MSSFSDAAVRFVAVGDVMMDVLCPEPPEASGRIHGDVVVRAGGSAVNAAAAAASAGATATVVGRIGGDRAGDLVLGELAELGIEARLARDDELATGVAVALGATRVIASRGANARLKPEDIPDAVEADALLVSGFALLQSGSADGARAALQRFDGPWVGIDVASPPLAAKAADADLLGARPGVVLLASAEEARAMTGAAPEEAVRLLTASFAVACVKLGPEGAVAASGERFERRAPDPLAARSPFGAGDAFGAILLVALAAGADLGHALELACNAGARAASGAMR